MKKLTRILLVVMTLAIIATSISACSFSDVTTKITDWIDKAYDYIVTGCVHEGGTATCTEKAICRICGRAYGKPLGHTPETIEGVSPTCTESGITDGSRCKVCGEILESQKPLSALGHSWSEWTVTQAATCTEDGEHERTCATCNEKETEVITSSGHEFGEWKPTTAATCTAGGEDTRKCNHCDLTETRTVSAKGHTEEVKEGYAATCTKTGLTDGVWCSACEKWIVAQKTIPATQHDYDVTVVDPKCAEQGYTLHKCKNCGDSYKSDYTMPTGSHTWSDWSQTKAASCTEEGEKTRKCSSCGATETMPIEKTAHVYTSVTTAPTCTEMGYTTYTCKNCPHSYVNNYVNPTGHSYTTSTTEPTCTEAGYTTYTCKCGDAYTSNYVPANGHSFTGDNTKCDNCDETRVLECKHTNTEKLDAVAATCTTNGLTEGLVCKDCKAVLTAQKIVPSKGGHTFGEWTTTKNATCTENGSKERSCSCGAKETEIIVATGHRYTDTTVDPTCTEAGYTEHTCTNTGCTYSYKDNYKAALGHDVSVWKQTLAPGCETEGEITGTCSRCSQGTITVKVAALGHKGGTATCTEQAKCTVCGHHYGDFDASTHTGKLDETWYSDGTTHWNQWSCCNAHANTADHSGGTATCTDAAKCKICGQSYGTAKGHSPVEGWTDNGDGTHYQKCENCDEHLNSTGHKYSETWEKGENGHWHVCACGATTTAITHTFKEGQCEVCGQNQPKTLRISTVEDLLAFRDAVNDGKTYAGWTIYLLANIDLEGVEFGGIGFPSVHGYASKAFCGTFEGCGKSIYNFKVTAPAKVEYGGMIVNDLATAGFFNTLGAGATVNNLYITNATIKSTHFAGGIVGYWSADNVTVKFCNVTNSVITSTPMEISEGKWDNGDKVGGIVGYAAGANGLIENCEVVNTTISAYRDIGGIAGCVDSASITVRYCHSDDNVTITAGSAEHDYKSLGDNTAGYHAGKIVGRNAGTIERCDGKAEINYVYPCSGGHSVGDWVEEKSATCTQTGTKGHYVCQNCNKNIDADKKTLLDDLTIAIDSNNHSFGTWVEEKFATCTESGTKGHKDCILCGKHFDNGNNEITDLTIGKLNHTYNETVATSDYLATAATCTAKATYYYSCSCGAQGTDTFESGDYAAHDYGTLISEQPANCTDTGVAAHYKCSVCNKLFDANKVEKTPEELTLPTNSTHKGTLSGWQSDADGHWQYYDCHSDVKVNEGPHAYGENGKCTVCDHPEPHEHTYTAVEGVEGLFTCTCGKNFKIDSTKTTWELLTDVSKLTAGSKIIIVGKEKDGDNYYSICTTQEKSNRKGVEITVSNNIATIGDAAVQEITIEKPGDYYLFKVSDTEYLYAIGKDNGIKTSDTITDNSKFNISIGTESGVENVATIKSVGGTKNWLRYNSGSTLFACYSSGQQPVYIYIQHIEYTYAEVPAHTCSKNVTGATCTENGKCSVCGRTVENSKIPHTYGENHFCECGAEQPKLYLATSSNWREANAWFAAYFWDENGNDDWARMTDNDYDGVYECYIPTGMKNVIILRKNPSNQNLNFDDNWFKSADLVIPTDGKNCYKITDWNPTGWTTFSGSKFYVRGFDGDWGVNDGNLMTFDSTTNLWTKVYDNASSGTHEFKITDISETWYDNNTGNNISVNVDNDYSKVTITFNALTFEIKYKVENHVHNYTYTNNGDDHTKKCTCETITEDHSYDATTHYCECGKVDPNYYFPKNISELPGLDDGTQVEFTGTVVKVNYNWSSTNNNMSVTVSDGNGNTFYIFKLATKVELCDVITVDGVIGSYYGSKQIAEGATATIGAEKNHIVEAKCDTDATCACGEKTVVASGHHYENGACTICGAKEGVVTKTESLAIQAKDGTSGTNSLSWATDNFNFLAEKASSSSAIVSTTSGHYRAYKDSTFTISSNNGQKIQKIVITTTGGSYNITSASYVTTSGVTVECNGTTCTITVNDGVELTEVALTGVAQFRMSKIEITYVD